MTQTGHQPRARHCPRSYEALVTVHGEECTGEFLNGGSDLALSILGNGRGELSLAGEAEHENRERLASKVCQSQDRSPTKWRRAVTTVTSLEFQSTAFSLKSECPTVEAGKQEGVSTHLQSFPLDPHLSEQSFSI